MVGWVKSVILLFMLSLSYAGIIESGDGGAGFAASTSAEKCQGADVQAVYTCIGNVVRVVSSVPGEGSTFYKPDGKVVECPVVAPSEMGAECLQLMTPNYCPTEAKCGTSKQSEFPGQSTAPEQTGDAGYYVIPGQAASDANKTNESIAPTPAPQPKPQKTGSAAAKPSQLEVPATSGTNGIDGALGYMVYVVAFLGIVSVGVLFMLFKNSLAEEAE